jgi:hypothetical protein
MLPDAPRGAIAQPRYSQGFPPKSAIIPISSAKASTPPTVPRAISRVPAFAPGLVRKTIQMI